MLGGIILVVTKSHAAHREIQSSLAGTPKGEEEYAFF
jgi:hypothetical protein